MILSSGTILTTTWVIIAAYGFGSSAIHLVRSRIFSSDMFSILIGALLIIGLGGWLSLLGWYNRAGALTLLIIGTALAVLRAVSRVFDNPVRRPFLRMPRLASIASLVSFAALAFVVVRNTGFGWFNAHDDMEGYLAFAEKLSQTGTLGEDPFSRRRLVSGWSGQTILDATFLSVGPLYGLKAVDMSMGLLAFGLVVAYWARQSWLKQFGAAALLVVLSFFWLPGANITSHFLAMASISAIAYFVLTADKSLSTRDWVMFAIVFSTALTLKNTVTTFLLLLVPILLVLLYRYFSAGFFRGFALVFTVFLATIVPFALSLFLSSGTLQYPFLGLGYQSDHLSLTATDAVPNLESLLIEFAKAPFRTPVFLLAIAISSLAIFLGKQNSRFRVFYLSTAGFVSLFVPFIASSGAFDAARYASVVMLPLLLAAILALEWSPRVNATVAVATLASVSGMSASMYLAFNPELPFKVEIYETPAWLTEEKYLRQLAKVERVQGAIPVGATVLVNGPTSYLWDFQRNHVLVGDLPGSSSPPPGLPLYSDASEISSYLLKQGVSYLVIDYRGHFDYEIYSSHLDPDWPGQWREDVMNQFRYYEVVLELQSVCGPLYDDGRTLAVGLTCGR